jgi:septal ring factor EnvC (AmiA/AmiB activator)
MDRQFSSSGQSWAQPSSPGISGTQRELDDVQSAIDEGRSEVEDLNLRSADLAKEIDRIRSDMLDASAAARPIEGEIAATTDRIAALNAEMGIKSAALEERSTAMVGALAALQRMAVRPPAALLVSPGNANDIIRTGLLLRSALPELETQANALRNQMTEIAELQEELDERQSTLVVARADLRKEQERLSDLAGEKEELLTGVTQQRTEAERSVADQVVRARDLEELIEELRLAAAAREAANNNRPADAAIFEILRPLIRAEGEMALPAQGRVLHRFGDSTGFGGAHRGMTIATPPGVQIVAPWDGKIAFSGPFQNFGLILIIDHGEGYHSLLAGFSNVNAVVDQWVLAGEPIGTAPTTLSTDAAGRAIDGVENESENGISSGPTLYIELREQGSPIDPLPWLAARNDRVQ